MGFLVAAVAISAMQYLEPYSSTAMSLVGSVQLDGMSIRTELAGSAELGWAETARADWSFSGNPVEAKLYRVGGTLMLCDNGATFIAIYPLGDSGYIGISAFDSANPPTGPEDSLCGTYNFTQR